VSSGPSDSQREPWWESKTALLVLGFVLTGLIGPWLQYVQKTLDAQRQSAYDVASRELTAMREARKEIAEFHVGMAVLTEHLNDLVLPSASDAVSARWGKELLDANLTARIREYAKISLMCHDFRDPLQIQKQLDECYTAWKATADCIHDFQLTKGKRDRERMMKTIHDARIQFDTGYSAMRKLMDQQIGAFMDAHR
jgi:hypothetical protein